MDILFKSKSSLQEVSFEASAIEEDDFSVASTLYLMDQLQSFPSSRSIEFEIPLPLTLMTGSELPGSKNFSFTPPTTANHAAEEPEHLVELLRAAHKLMNAGFTVIKIGTWRWHPQIMDHLSISQLSLKELDLDFDGIWGHLVWDFAISCPNLRSLTLELHYP